MRLSMIAAAAVAALTAAPALAQGVYVTVDAAANSTTGGTSLTVGGLIAGKQYHIYQNPNDLWSSGPLPRFSDGNGIVNRVANAADDSVRRRVRRSAAISATILRAA